MNQATKTFQRIEAIFNEAQDAPDHLRPGLIEFRAEGDPSVAAEVWSLLKACDEVESVTAARRLDPRTGRETGAPPRRIGPYLLDRLLGRGGMGAVYLAHRADGQFNREVAIKLIDLPLATDLFRERFRQERQILAGLQHPYIARLLDGGVTDEGDPYLVMEYVDGMPIHHFCDEKQLATEQRVELFLRVCEAVQFAHQNLVVHRDLKPDNILVAGDLTPRLLDFGTAKLLSPAVSRLGTDFTREGYLSFTPQYASPEQVLGNPITTASDTYSLGVLLYLLLTGVLPYELRELSTAEMLRVVCEQPPRRPSQAAGDRSRLDPDLEAILLKALRKEAKERYLTAEQLAMDVRAWIEGRPVGARRGTLRYRAQKFVRRHRLGLAGAALLVFTLLAGVAGVLWQARVANQQRRRAEARSADLRQLSNSLLSELDEAIKDLPGSTGAQKLLVTRVLEHLDRMAKDAEGDRQAQLDLADAYTRLGNIQGNPYEQNLGDPSGAQASIAKAMALAQTLVHANPQDREALRALATAQEDRGEVLSEAGTAGQAAASLQAAVETYDRLLALAGAETSVLLEAARANETLGDLTGEDIGLADVASAVTAYRRSIDFDRRALQLDSHDLRATKSLAHMQFKIGNAELDSDPNQALKDLQSALQSEDALSADDRARLPSQRERALILRKQAVAFSGLGEYAQANPLFAEALETFRRIASADAGVKDVRALGDLKRLYADMADSHEDASDPAVSESGDSRRELLAARAAWEQAAEAIEQILKQDVSHEDWKAELASAQVQVASLQMRLKQPGNAEKSARANLAVLRGFALREHASSRMLSLYVTGLLSVPQTAGKDSGDAETCAERLVNLTHRKDAAALLSLAQADRAGTKLQQSRLAASEGLALLPVPRPGDRKENLRKRLEIAAQPGR